VTHSSWHSQAIIGGNPDSTPAQLLDSPEADSVGGIVPVSVTAFCASIDTVLSMFNSTPPATRQALAHLREAADRFDADTR
jgi:hypothetical protein